MEKSDWINKMQEKLETLDLKFHVKQLNKFYNFMNLVLEENKNINLTAINDPEEFITKHFIDSLTILKYIEKEENIIDVGTGAGFPGIPLKLAKEELKITLLDSLNKRVMFLEKIINNLELNNINVVHARVEDFAKEKKYRESYDVATSRAVASLNVLLEYLMPLVKLGGKCICMKGSNIKEEIEGSKKALEILGANIEKIDEIILPNSDIKRNIIVIKKIKSTPDKFPRKAGIPSKKPIV